MKAKLEFIKAGEEFEVPKMSMEVHEAVMDYMTKFDKMQELKYNRLFNKYLVAYQLNKVDSSKTIEEYFELVRSLHPDEFIELFGKIWNEGKRVPDKFREPTQG